MSGIHFAFLIGGEEINPETAEDPVQVDIMEQIMNNITVRMEGLVCPEHQQAPRFLCSGDSFDDLSIEVHGCCEQLVELTRQRMESL
ncbi:MAG: hypothetical protein OQK94_09785 [Gammaproteobacteria bacterium]|nr:hypothetical protein [Gammaproteobacteria bacterium]MCW8840027.1 hypothetical protein [Gammaproteobacteria bacterium]MCW8958108.1 hypothetical protein [Gammaproteobacteria bacterium]MCW8972062.1 hypothetical protein [Gammaproteobacteria bacterium]MCW8993575.1 hypothetical protein [Gammaproteobacteria bacterium]